MENMTESKREEMRTSAELVQKATAKELADAAMSGFFAGILSREAITTEKSA